MGKRRNDMKYTGPVYRPPIEHTSPLLQVTVGCAHNSCTFCTMYRSVDFSVDSMEEIEDNLRAAQKYYKDPKRMFLVNGDAFVLSARKLKDISKLITKYFPSIETITMYASIRNIMDKTDEDLRDLKENYKINDLYIGIESGHDEALEFLNKGYNLQEAKEQLERLDRSGINYIQLYMLGTLGRKRGIEGAQATAHLINQTNPSIVWVQAMRSFPESELESRIESGEFIPAYELEILEEERELIRLIDKEDLQFLGIHPINAVTISGNIPRERQDMIAKIDRSIEEIGHEKLKTVIKGSSL